MNSLFTLSSMPHIYSLYHIVFKTLLVYVLRKNDKINDSYISPRFDALGPVVRKPINANTRLKVNRGFHLAHLKLFKRLISS